MDESKLIQDLIQGSQRAFDELYDMHAGNLYSFCIAVTKSEADAEDIVQDTFVKLWRIRRNIRPVSSISPLLFTIARNSIINSYNKRVNSQIYADYVAYRNSESFDIADSGISYLEFVAIIENKISSLPKTQQKVIKMSRFSGLSNKEIAAELNLSEQTIKNQLSMGLKNLKESLAPLSDVVL